MVADHELDPVRVLAEIREGLKPFAKKLRRPFSENHVVGMLCKIGAVALNPGCLVNARIGSGHSEAGDDGVIGAGDDTE